MAVQSTPLSSVEAGNQGGKPGQGELLLNLMVKLLRDKGQPAVAQLQQKIKSGEGLVVKGVKVDIDIMKQALNEVGAGAAKPPTQQSSLFGRAGTIVASVQKPAAGSSGASTGARWCAGPPSAIALAQKAIQECETAEPFARKVANVSDNRIVILTKPNVLSHPTGEFLAPREVAEVIARCARVQDGRTYLRLKRSSGWVSTRSCRDIWKLVLKSADDDSTLEPTGCPTSFESRAAQVLQRVDQEGRRLDSEGNEIIGGRVVTQEIRSFRAVGMRSLPVFVQPSSAAAKSGNIQGREEFVANAVCLVAEDGRAYLRLQDGTGWVCERSQNDFSRYAIEPADHPSSNPRKRQAEQPYTGTSCWHEKVVAYSERNEMVSTMETWVASLLSQLGARSFEDFSRLFPGYEYEMEVYDSRGASATKEFEGGIDIKKDRWPITMKVKLPAQKVVSAGEEFRAALQAQKSAKKGRGKGRGAAR